MLRNYIKIAWRNLLKNKGFSVLNIFCLAIGITFSMLIGVYILNESAINHDIKHVDDQYVIKSDWSRENIGIPVTTLGPLAKTIKEEYPNLVENYYWFDAVVNIVSSGDKHFRTQIAAGDTTLVSMYGFPLLYGDPQHAFRNNQSAVVTENFARKFFNTADAIGKVITVQTPADGQKHNFAITAVLKTMPANTVTNFTGTAYDVYLPMDANQYFQGGDKGDNWSNVYMVSMLQLKHGITPKSLEQPFASTLEKYQPAFVKGYLKIKLAPMRDYYLKDNNAAVQKMLTTLTIIAAFILVLAIINFVNISVGTSVYRLKEIGLRKVFGGSRKQIVLQHLCEALILTSAAAVLSAGLYELLLPVFESMLNTTLVHFWLLGLTKIALLVAVVFLTGIIAGIYPALVLSSSNITNAIRGKMDTVKGSLTVRKTLLIVQFTLAIVVFISAITVSKQVSYFFNKDIGYNKDQVMVISSLPRQWDSAGIVKMENLRPQFMAIPGVKSISLSYDIPDGNGGGHINVYPGNSNTFSSVVSIAVDPGFAKTYGLQVTEGSFFADGNARAANGKILLNETALKILGLTSPVGKTVHIGALNGATETVIGVVKDFNLGSLKEKVQPLVLAGMNEPFTRSYRYFSVKLDAAGISNTIDAVQEKCQTLFPDAGFDYTFMDDKFQSLYQSELQLKKAADVATGLNLLIVFTGIIGVLAFTLSKRTKEIAVRKVLGANAGSIISIFLKEYGLLILASNLIAWPIAYKLTSDWLQGYAYRFQQNAAPYLFVCFFILAVAFALIVAQCFRAALANPVKSLRSE
ncbi:MAG TPA: ABC transporter permease [Mucilaginibacter sp.]|nr:ABC transporter permease [Mucilaginibacter sp.]